MRKSYFDQFSGIIIYFFLVLTLAGCTAKDTDKDGIPDDQDKCPTVYAKTKDGCPLERKINNVHIYLDNSASMAGYFQNDAQYKTIVSDVAAKINENIKPPDIWFIADQASEYPFSVQQFTSDIATTRIANRKSSELHKIISEIAAKTGPNDVSLLVSDCILSFPDEDVKNNPEINRNEAPNALKENIFTTFSELKKHGFATSVFAFESRFYGTYYDYQNVKTVLKGSPRPFYIWVIANKDLLSKFDANLEDMLTIKPARSLYFGLVEQPVTSCIIVPQLQRSGEWAKDGSGIGSIVMEKGQALKFSAVVNLEKLPRYAQDIHYLQDNLKLVTNGCTASFQVLSKAQADRSRLKNEKQIMAFENNTDVIVFNVTDMPLPQASIYMSLPLHYDAWYLDWSTMNDKNIMSQPDKTFALQYLISGVEDAYENKNKNYIDFSITLNK